MLRDYEAAPIDEKLRTTLHFLKTLDPERAIAAGVSREALRNAVDVKAGFDLITRFADTIGAQPGSKKGLSREEVLEGGGRFFERGYVYEGGRRMADKVLVNLTTGMEDPEKVTLAKKASSMKFNPVVLGDAALADILTRAIQGT